MIDLSITLGRLKLRNPILVASGTFGYAKEMAGARRFREARRHHPEDRDRRAAGRQHAAANRRDRQRHAQRHRPRQRRPRPLPRPPPAVPAHAADRRSSATSPARPRTSSSRWRRAFTQVGHGTGRAGTEPVVPERVRRARLRHRPGVDAARSSGAAATSCPDLPLIAKLTPNVTDITVDREGRGRRRGGRRQRGEHVRRHGGGLAAAQADPRQRDRRPERPGDQAAGAAVRLADRAS